MTTSNFLQQKRFCGCRSHFSRRVSGIKD